MNANENKPRLGVPIHAQQIFLSNVTLLARDDGEALQMLHRLHSEAHPDQVSDLSVDDVSFDQPVYFFDLDRPNITVDGFRLRCQLFGLGGSAHPGLALQAKRSHLFLTSLSPETVTDQLDPDRHAQVFSIGSNSIEDTLEEALLYLMEHATVLG